MNLTGTNGKEYNVRLATGQNFEIQCGNLVYVFEDLSIGKYESRRKEAVFYSFKIDEQGVRQFIDRHSVQDFNSEFLAFLNSEVWQQLQEGLINSLLNKIENTEIQL